VAKACEPSDSTPTPTSWLLWRLGFKKDLDFTLLRAEKLGAINAEKLPKISRRQLATVDALDDAVLAETEKNC
jgi:hypothetical protein